MNAKLTQDELQAIKERAEKATAGPWYTEVDGDVYSWGGERVIYDVTNGEGASCVVMRSADRSFIENARQDIPKLVAEVERLRHSEIALRFIKAACLAAKSNYIEESDIDEILTYVEEAEAYE